MTFMASKAGDAPEDLLLACDLDISTVNARERIPGVALEVGKPNVISFKESEVVPARSGQWVALLLKTPNGSDYSMLMLLRLANAGTQNAAPSKDGEPIPNAESQLNTATADQPVVPVVEIDGKQHVIVGYRENPTIVRGFGSYRDPITIVEGRVVVPTDRLTKVSIVPGKAFGSGFVTVVDNVFRAFLYHPDALTTLDDGFTYGPFNGSDLSYHHGYTSFSGTLTSDRDLSDVFMILLLYEDLDKNDARVPKVWIVGTEIGHLEAGKAHPFNETTPLVAFSENPIRWTTLVFSGGVQIPSTGGNKVADELLGRKQGRINSKIVPRN
jgi:hypothetical protein